MFFLRSACFPFIRAPGWALFYPLRICNALLSPHTMPQEVFLFPSKVAATGWDLKTHPEGDESTRTRGKNHRQKSVAHPSTKPQTPFHTTGNFWRRSDYLKKQHAILSQLFGPQIVNSSTNSLCPWH